MKFEVGKFYKHTTGHQLAIICTANTTMFGEALIAEQNTSIDFVAVGSDEAAAVNYTEITVQEWMKNFNPSNVAVMDKWIEKILPRETKTNKKKKFEHEYPCKNCGETVTVKGNVDHGKSFDCLCTKCWSLEHPQDNIKVEKPSMDIEQFIPLTKLKELVDIQGSNGNWNYDNYMLGMFNGMELMTSIIEGREPKFRSCEEEDFLENKHKSVNTLGATFDGDDRFTPDLPIDLKQFQADLLAKTLSDCGVSPELFGTATNEAMSQFNKEKK